MFNLETVRMRNGYRQTPGTIRRARARARMQSFGGGLIYGDVKVERARCGDGVRSMRSCARGSRSRDSPFRRFQAIGAPEKR